jgi:hypothetical protein
MSNSEDHKSLWNEDWGRKLTTGVRRIPVTDVSIVLQGRLVIKIQHSCLYN